MKIGKRKNLEDSCLLGLWRPLLMGLNETSAADRKAGDAHNRSKPGRHPVVRMLIRAWFPYLSKHNALRHWGHPGPGGLPSPLLLPRSCPAAAAKTISSLPPFVAMHENVWTAPSLLGVSGAAYTGWKK